MGKGKIDPQYFLDKMDHNEVKAILEAVYEDYKDKWEQTRYISFITAAVNCSKITQPKDLMKFSWEKEEESEVEVLTKEQRIERQEMMINYINKSQK